MLLLKFLWVISVLCKNLKELQNALQDKIDYALLTDVSDTISEVMIDHIIRDVYDVYETHMYERRYTKGGLLDKNNINSSIEENTLVIENNTKGSHSYKVLNFNYVIPSKNKDNEIAGVIETGKGYDIESWVTKQLR